MMDQSNLQPETHRVEEALDRAPSRLLTRQWFLAPAWALLLATPQLALAQAGPVGGVLDQAVQLLTGQWATSAAIIAVAVLGWMSLSGRVPWSIGVSVIAGITFIFGSAWFVNTFQGAAT